MERASDLIQRRPPVLDKRRGTIYPSVSQERLSIQYCHEWPSFKEKVLEICQSVDLSGLVSITDESERSIVGNELGLTACIDRHICDAVAKALSVTALSHLKFGDIQSKRPSPPAKKVPHVVLFSDNGPLNVQGVGVYKPFWLLDLDQFLIDEDRESLGGLEPHLGQLASYMGENKVKHGFITTYKSAIFIKRVNDFRFELSLPISKDSARPSLRQCFLAFCCLASDNPVYMVPDGFNPTLLRTPGQQNSTRASGLRPDDRTAQQHPQGASSFTGVNSSSIIFGEADGNSHGHVNCNNLLWGSRDRKAVFEVTLGGSPAIAKCFADEEHESFIEEASVYEKLRAKQPNAYRVLPSLLAYGKVTCSSVFPSGHVLLISKAPGEILSSIWDDLLIAERRHIYDECRTAVSVIRSLNLVNLDAGKHNIVYDRTSAGVKMIDFETVKYTPDTRLRSDASELVAIFGRSFARDRANAGG